MIPYLVAGVIYWVFNFILEMILTRVEKKLNYYHDLTRRTRGEPPWRKLHPLFRSRARRKSFGDTPVLKDISLTGEP